MKEYIVYFNNGVWNDITTFKTTASSEQEAVDNVLNDNPDYSTWNVFVKEKLLVLNNYGDDNFSITDENSHLRI